MIRIQLPPHLRSLAGISGCVEIELTGSVTPRQLLDELERRYPVLRGTIRDHGTRSRRPQVRFFACKQDVSWQPEDAPLPDEVVRGEQPFVILGAMSGG